MGWTATIVGGVFAGDQATGGGGTRAVVGALGGGKPKINAPPGSPEGLVSDTDADNAASMRARRQRQLAAQAAGRSDTILTGPQGVLGDAPGTKKTLLGY